MLTVRYLKVHGAGAIVDLVDEILHLDVRGILSRPPHRILKLLQHRESNRHVVFALSKEESSRYVVFALTKEKGVADLCRHTIAYCRATE
jgi:hypothetical protein